MTTLPSEIFHTKPIDTPIVACTGGKGGTGKTVVAINLATQLANMGKKVLIIDCDVDSPNVAILLDAELKDKQVIKRFLPEFILENCTFCGNCAEFCRAHAVLQVGDKPPLLFPELCTGCEVCQLVCPSDAIVDKEKVVGYTYEGHNNGVDIVSGELKLREPESAIAVDAARERAFKKIKENGTDYDIVVIDTAPGAHCDVIRALQGADLVLAVTEPTPFGAHDLDLIIELTKNVMRLNSKVVLNRSDIIADSQLIDSICKKKAVDMLARIPYDDELIKSYVKGIPVVNYNPESASGKILIQLAEKTKELLLR